METHLLYFSLNDLLLYSLTCVGLTFAVLLWITRTNQQPSNRILSLTLVAQVFSTVGIAATDLHLAIFLPVSRLPIQVTTAVGPLLYLFTCRTTRPDDTWNSRNGWHFIPVLFQLAWQVAELWPGKESKILAALPHGLFLIVPFLSIIIYAWLSHREITRFRKKQHFIGNDRPRHEQRWLQFIVTGFALLWIVWIPVEFASGFLLNGKTSLVDFYPLYLALFAIAIGLAAASYLHSQRTAPLNRLQGLPPELSFELRQKGVWLKDIMKRERYFEDPDLNLNSLAGKVGLHPHELSRLINTVFKKSFSDYISERRVAEVIKKLRNPAYQQLTLLGVAFECGFNSKTSFNRVFKQITGTSPVDFKKQLTKQRPTYNPGHSGGADPLVSANRFTLRWTVDNSNRNFMLKNYFTTAWRSLKRNRSFALINVSGLAIGVAACLLIFLIVQHEISFDNFHRYKDRIFRVVSVINGLDGKTISSGAQLPLGAGLRLEYPKPFRVAAIMRNRGSHYAVKDPGQGNAVKKFREDQAYYADPELFEIFDFTWLAGNPKTALADPNTIVLTRDEAVKFFGDWHKAMGQIIGFENKRDFKVTGILENPPANTDLPVAAVMSWISLVEKGGDLDGNTQDWVSKFGSGNVYMLLPPGVREQQINEELIAFANKHIPAPYNATTSMQLQPLLDMHFNTKVNVYGGHPFSRQLINVISLIGLFLLIIACVNFINLSTAQAVNRSKEVGIRKVLGSNRARLIVQFICETLLITLFAIVLASILAVSTLPMLNQLLEIEIQRQSLLSPQVLLFLAAVAIGVTILAGFYPALVLSGFNPMEALKNKIRTRHPGALSLRRGLVIAQFCIAQILVIGTLVLIYQMKYFSSQSLGFNKDAVITVPFPDDSLSRTKINPLKMQLMQQSGIRDVSVSIFGPAEYSAWSSDFKFDNASKETDFSASLKWADPNFFKLYDIPFVAGGPYKNTDTISGYVVNETLLHKLGITDPNQAIGKYIMLWDDLSKKARITGVVKDFNVGSLRDAIPAVLMGPWSTQYSKLNIKIEPQNVSRTLANVEALWNNSFPTGLYEFQFLDKTIAGFYNHERELATLYKTFAGIAIFISCLGLYGLVSFMAVQRVKEVGIRKTLGATVSQIVYLFSKEFTLLVIIAFAIAAPIGYYFMHSWLQDFTYRITIGPDIFVLAILFSLSIAWLTVGYKAVQAAFANPVNSLRAE